MSEFDIILCLRERGGKRERKRERGLYLVCASLLKKKWGTFLLFCFVFHFPEAILMP